MDEYIDVSELFDDMKEGNLPESKSIIIELGDDIHIINYE